MLDCVACYRVIADFPQAVLFRFAVEQYRKRREEGVRLAKISLVWDRGPVSGCWFCGTQYRSGRASTVFPFAGAAGRHHNSRADGSERVEEREMRRLAMPGSRRQLGTSDGRNLFGLHLPF